MRTSTSACHPVIRPSRQTGQSLVSGAQSPLPRNVHEPADASGRRSLAGWSTFIPSKKHRKRSGVSEGERALSHQLSAVSLGHKETTKGRTEKERRGEKGKRRKGERKVPPSPVRRFLSCVTPLSAKEQARPLPSLLCVAPAVHHGIRSQTPTPEH